MIQETNQTLMLLLIMHNYVRDLHNKSQHLITRPLWCLVSLTVLVVPRYSSVSMSLVGQVCVFMHWAQTMPQK